MLSTVRRVSLGRGDLARDPRILPLWAASVLASLPIGAVDLADLDPFFAYDRPAQFSVATGSVNVPVRDGYRIPCQLYRPARNGVPVRGEFPGIVYNYTAYVSAADAYGEQSAYFVARGYNALVCQARGAGTPDGVADPFGVQEQEDNVDVIEWMAEQAWSTGRIGQAGVSYGGHSALLAAVNEPPSLKAIIPVNGISDWYENTIYRGGIYSERIKAWQNWVAPGTLDLYAANPTYNEFWRAHSVKSRWHLLNIPTLQINGWYDRYRDGMVQNYLARPENVWLISGPWSHGDTSQQFQGLAPGVFLAWWDYWLAGDTTVPLPNAPITTYETPGPGVGKGWQQYETWPPPGTQNRALALTVQQSLAEKPGPSGSSEFTVNVEPDDGSEEQRLVFFSHTLAEDLVLTGSGQADLVAAFSAGDGNLAVVISDLDPHGSETRVTAGWRKASLRNSLAVRDPLQAGVAYDVRVPLWPAHYRFARGHRVKVRISSDDYPEISSDAPAGEVTLHLGAGGSSITLPIR